jgi:prolipoprotein diacylglyceryl transferase
VLALAFPAYIPSPSVNGISIGSLRLHVYGLMIAAGIVAAVWIAQRRWEKIGGRPGTISALAVWGVPGGLIGARVYSLITSWQVDTGGHIIRAFEIWQGGLGIWGGVVGGIALGLVGAHRMRLPFRPLLDCVAAAFPLAQAIGRWGNYFNQELYGRPSKLPWAVKIDNPAPVGNHVYTAGTTFQPTFLYESIWDLIVLGLVIWVERRFRIKRGYLIAAYAAFYTFGRFWTEYLRIDTAHKFWGLRLNDWTSIVVFVIAGAVLLVRGRAGEGDDRAGDPLPGTPEEAGDAGVAPSGPDTAGEQEGSQTARVGGGAADPTSPNPAHESDPDITSP